jgi:lysozyme
VSVRERIPVYLLALSFAGGVAILQREDYRGVAYIPTKGDVPTLGYGSTEGVKLGDTTTPVRALLRTANELDTKYEAAVKRCVKVPLHQAEYDQYVRLAHNIGVNGFCGSTVVKEANAQRYASACAHILDWRKFRGQDCSKPNKVCAGLWTDRLETHDKCMAAQ